MKAYLGFTPEHEATLGALSPAISSAFDGIVERFYDAIMANERARAVFAGGPTQIARQKVQLHAWLEGVFGGVYDENYLKLRARIGRTHVRIGLDQRYMFGAMNVVREGLHRAVPESLRGGARDAHTAIDKICDFELAIMLETYAEDHMQSMRDRERLATLGQVAGFIGHELRNPLAVMETSLHLIGRQLSNPDASVRRHLARLREQVEVSNGIITDLLELVRDRPLDRHPVDLALLVDRALEQVPGCDREVVTVELGDLALGGASRQAWVDEVQLRLLITNLVTNALQAIGQGAADGRVFVRASRQDLSLVLSVQDNGPGIADEVQHRLFEPLTTTQAHGIGLGLALCRRIVQKHGGEIVAENAEAGGALFKVTLPDVFRGGG